MPNVNKDESPLQALQYKRENGSFGKKVVLCVDGLCVKDGKLLLLKRNVEPFRGFWHVVGGHVDDGETLKEALIREFQEETGLTVEVGDLLCGRIEETFDRVKIIVALKVVRLAGEIKLNHENTEYGWFNPMPPNIVHDYHRFL
jgi:ADP-ribose pyrophosphatase YjhB (NUDIX family)